MRDRVARIYELRLLLSAIIKQEVDPTEYRRYVEYVLYEPQTQDIEHMRRLAELNKQLLETLQGKSVERVAIPDALLGDRKPQR